MPPSSSPAVPSHRRRRPAAGGATRAATDGSARRLAGWGRPELCALPLGSPEVYNPVHLRIGSSDPLVLLFPTVCLIQKLTRVGPLCILHSYLISTFRGVNMSYSSSFYKKLYFFVFCFATSVVMCQLKSPAGLIPFFFCYLREENENTDTHLDRLFFFLELKWPSRSTRRLR